LPDRVGRPSLRLPPQPWIEQVAQTVPEKVIRLDPLGEGFHLVGIEMVDGGRNSGAAEVRAELSGQEAKDLEQLHPHDSLVAATLDMNESIFNVEAEGDSGPGQRDGIDPPVCTKPVNPVSIRASKNSDGREDADTAIRTTGLWLLSSDPRSVAIR